MENVATAPDNVKEFYDDCLSSPRIRINAAQFGYVKRDRCFWGSVNGEDTFSTESRIPPNFDIVQAGKELRMIYR